MLRINKLQIRELIPSTSSGITNYKLQILNRSGFSFVELLVVFAILGILFSISIASYSNFQKSAYLKNAALQLKSDLRLAQNKAISGDKRLDDPPALGLKCSKVDASGRSLYTLVGWYLTVTEGSDSYTINSTCRDANIPLAPDLADVPVYKSFKLPTGVVVSDIDGSVAGAQILFQPLTPGVSVHAAAAPPFYVAGVMQPEIIYTKPFEITLTSSSGGSYQVIIQQSGEISEKKL